MHYLSDLVLSFSQFMPLELFVFLGGIIEEVIAPIPSPVIMTFAGAAVASLEKAWPWILWYGVLGGIGKSLGALILYLISDKFEDVFTDKFGKFFGLEPKHFETYGNKLANQPNLFWWLFLVRAFPIAPSGVLSVLSGVFKVPLKIYFIATMLGCIVRDVIYVFIGYSANDFLNSILSKSMGLDKLLTFVVATLILAYFIYLANKKRK